jgi:superfamily II DNA or RNA helicase
MDDALKSSELPALLDRMARAWIGEPFAQASLGAITLAPHQADAVARLREIIADYRGAMLADEVGMGKTYTALAVARTFASFFVVGPASLRGLWADALGLSGLTGRFLSFESLSRSRPDVTPRDAIVIVDEAHHVRNPRTRRYDALARFVAGARVLLLSATPIHNRPGELRGQLALFLGARAYTLGEAQLPRLIVRRGHGALTSGARLPRLSRPRWLPIPGAPAVLRALQQLAPPVPPADGGAAAALIRLGLIRTWTSSDAALRAALRRRLHRATALSQALDAGRFPTRRELTAWTLFDGAMQLAFPELVAREQAVADGGAVRAAIDAHVQSIRETLRALDAADDGDAARAAALRRLRARHPLDRIVAFSQFAETVRAMYRAMERDGAVALVTASGARVASGAIPRAEIIRQFGSGTADTSGRLPLTLLISTDVLSEGLNLHGAAVLVHLDMPWTIARLEQRLGRIRRLGAAHERVHVYAIGPPVPTRSLVTVIRALQRKARVIGSLLGANEVASQEPLFGQRLSRTSRPPQSDLTGWNEALRTVLAAWRRGSGHALDDCPQGAAAAPAAVVRTARCTDPCRGIAGPPERSPAEAAALAADWLDRPWQALALARLDSRARLLAVSPDRVSEHPRDVLEVARRIGVAHHQRTARDTGGLDAPAEARFSQSIRAARQVLARWLDAARGAALAAPATEAPSREHLRALRRIAELRAQVPRHRRARLTELAARCRDLVVAARGAGAERMLGEWADSADPTIGAGTAEDRLVALATLVEPIAGPATPAPPCFDGDAELAFVCLVRT